MNITNKTYDEILNEVCNAAAQVIFEQKVRPTKLVAINSNGDISYKDGNVVLLSQEVNLILGSVTIMSAEGIGRALKKSFLADKLTEAVIAANSK